MSDENPKPPGVAAPPAEPASPAAQREERGLSLVAEEPPAQPAEEALAGAAEAPAPPNELEAARRECASLKEQLLRRQADFENHKKRLARERQTAVEDAVAELTRALVPTLDNLERALAAKGSADAVREGIALVRRDMLALLEARGLRVLDPVGQPFDPKHHQALTHEVTPGVAPGIVVQVFGKGYLLGERLLRPALVRVAKEPSEEGQAAPETVH
jgi:molecular chaperone GrpE